MAGKFLSIAICAFLSNQFSPNLVSATLQTGGQGVVRVDLEKKYIDHLDNVQLIDEIDINLMIDSPIAIESDVLIDNEEYNYSQLREI